MYSKPTERKRIPRTRNMKNTILSHIIIKLLKTTNKEKIFKVARRKKKKNFAYKRTKIRMKVDILSKTMKASGDWDTIFKVLKGKK